MWLAKHKKMTVLIWNILVWIPIVMLFDMIPSLRSLWWMIYGIVMFLFSLIWADSIRIYILRNAENMMNSTCDPHVLLAAVETLLPFIMSRSQKMLPYIDMSCALLQIGRFNDG